MSAGELPESAETLRAQAEGCRRLARSVRTDAAAEVLNRLAVNHDLAAQAIEEAGSGDEP